MKEATVNPTCPRCNAPLASDAIDGLCPRCLGALNFDAFTTEDGNGDLPCLSPPTAEELAPFFPQFEIQSLLGRGGMGVVYKARQKSLDRWVALKLLAPERAAEPSFAHRFASEARTLAALGHPHIVGIHDFGEAGGYFYLLMEYVDGDNLRHLLNSKSITQAEALAMILPVCDALRFAHERGIVHRDIKPENLLIDTSNTVKIADFGIARMMNAAVNQGENSPFTATPHAVSTMASGTPAYAAPEQWKAAATDHRADIYSLGVVLHEMLTGKRPGSEIAPSRHGKLDAILQKALAKDPSQRFETVEEFRSGIAQVHEALLRPRPKRWRILRWMAATAAIIILLFVIALFVAPSLLPSREDAVQGSFNLTGILSRAASVLPSRPAEPTDVRQQFEENRAALIEARRKAAQQTRDGGSPTPTLKAEIHLLEARDRELSALIGGTAPASNE